ncbi:MAG TPA: hypothetical protein VGB91_03040 [Rhizomicrobium sp.]
MAAALEKQFEECNRAANRLLAEMSGNQPDYYNMPIAIALLRTAGQLGAAIARLDPASPPGATSEESQNRDSIPT